MGRRDQEVLHWKRTLAGDGALAQQGTHSREHTARCSTGAPPRGLPKAPPRTWPEAAPRQRRTCAALARKSQGGLGLTEPSRGHLLPSLSGFDCASPSQVSPSQVGMSPWDSLEKVLLFRLLEPGFCEMIRGVFKCVRGSDHLFVHSLRDGENLQKLQPLLVQFPHFTDANTVLG